jgi:hypothetical protein
MKGFSRVHLHCLNLGDALARKKGGFIKAFAPAATLVALIAFARAAEPPSAPNLAFDFKTSGRGGSISFDAKETAASRSITRNWQTDWGSYDRDFFQSKTISISLTALGAANFDGAIEVFWFARKLETKTLFIFSRETKPISFGGIKPRLSRMEATMPDLASNVVNYASLGIRDLAGSKLAGWMVVLRDGSGTVLRHYSNNPTVEALTRDAVAFGALLATHDRNKPRSKQ